MKFHVSYLITSMFCMSKELFTRENEGWEAEKEADISWETTSEEVRYLTLFLTRLSTLNHQFDALMRRDESKGSEQVNSHLCQQTMRGSLQRRHTNDIETLLNWIVY